MNDNPLFWNEDDPFEYFINWDLQNLEIEDDIIRRERLRPQIESALTELLLVRDAGALFEGVMTDDQRITQELLTDMIYELFKQDYRYHAPKERIALTIAWAWWVLLKIDSTIVRRTDDSE